MSHPGATRVGRFSGNYQKINVPGFFQNVPPWRNQGGTFVPGILKKCVEAWGFLEVLLLNFL